MPGKLVRDGIPDIIRSDGREPDIRVLDAAEYAVALRAKLSEETAEAVEAASDSDLLDELADVFEVVKALAVQAGASVEEVARRAEVKARERGAFDKRVWLAPGPS